MVCVVDSVWVHKLTGVRIELRAHSASDANCTSEENWLEFGARQDGGGVSSLLGGGHPTVSALKAPLPLAVAIQATTEDSLSLPFVFRPRTKRHSLYCRRYSLYLQAESARAQC